MDGQPLDADPMVGKNWNVGEATKMLECDTDNPDRKFSGHI